MKGMRRKNIAEVSFPFLLMPDLSRSDYGGDLGSTGAGKPKLQCRGSVYPYNWQTANLAADEAEYALAA
jgi:hypothetical protein